MFYFISHILRDTTSTYASPDTVVHNIIIICVYYILCEFVYFNILSLRNIPVVGCHEYAQGYRRPGFSTEKIFSLFKRRSVAILTFEFQMETAIFDCGL